MHLFVEDYGAISAESGGGVRSITSTGSTIIFSPSCMGSPPLGLPSTVTIWISMLATAQMARRRKRSQGHQPASQLGGQSKGPPTRSPTKCLIGPVCWRTGRFQCASDQRRLSRHPRLMVGTAMTATSNASGSIPTARFTRSMTRRCQARGRRRKESQAGEQCRS